MFCNGPVSIRVFALLLPAIAGWAAAQTFPDRTHWGTNGYVEYIAGNMPIVISSPHGGYLTPAAIPDRTYGVITQDRRTQELSRALYRALRNRTGLYPHLIINQLHRIKLDANRDIVEAAQGNLIAEQAWREYHAFIEQAKAAVVTQFGSGLFIDMHGHGHPIDWIELGYALSAADLDLPDTALRSPTYINRSTIRALALRPGVDFPELLRGTTSLGGRLASKGHRSVPGPSDPSPGTNAYFIGGYNVRRHGSQAAGTIDGVQIEHPWILRKDAEIRGFYTGDLAEALDGFFQAFYRIDLETGPRVTVTAVDPYACETGFSAAFRFSRTGNLAHPLTVPFSLSGTATEGHDFQTLPRHIVIPAFTSTADLVVTPLDDSLLEGKETLIVLVEGGIKVGNPSRATIVVEDDEGNPLLEGLWTLDEISAGVSPDTSGKGRNAVLHPGGGNAPAPVAGKYGKALSFDEVDDCLKVQRFSFAPAGSFTLAFWFKVSSSSQSQYQYLFSHGSPGTPESLNIYFSESTGQLRTNLAFRNDLTAGNVLDVTRNFMDSAWHHYCLTVRPDEVSQVYIDGEVRAEAFFAGDTFDPPGDIFIGARNDLNASRFYGGVLDDIRIWSRVLCGREVMDLHAFSPGSVISFGKGCSGLRPDVPVHTLAGSPEAGERIRFMAGRCPVHVSGLLAVGLSKDTWMGHSLPLSFTSLGAPGCNLYVSLDALMPFTTSSTGTGSVPFPVPYDPVFIGITAYSQCFLLDAYANQLGLICSGALDIRLGGIR